MTTRVADVVRCKLPLVPVIVKANVPLVALVAVLTVIVVDPEVVTDVGLKLALAPLARPATVNVTVPVNPFDGVTVTA